MSEQTPDQSSPIPGTFSTHPFFNAVDERLRVLLTASAQSFSFEDGESLAQLGEPADSFYLIQHGNVAVLCPNESEVLCEIDRLHAGDVVGWSWLVPPHRWQFTCKAVGKVSGIRFNGEWLRNLCHDHQDLGFQIANHLLSVVSHRLFCTRGALAQKIKEAAKRM